jgi:hypothetical protein
MATQNAWDSADQLDGLDLIDKSNLIDIPFRITGLYFQENNSGVSICYIDGERQDRSTFTFSDSSTGVRAQLVQYLTSKGLDAVVETGDYQEISLVAPSGLRVSEYEIGDRGRPGKTRMAKTYYLTTSGRRAAAKGAEKTAPQKRTTGAAK